MKYSVLRSAQKLRIDSRQEEILCLRVGGGDRRITPIRSTVVVSSRKQRSMRLSGGSSASSGAWQLALTANAVRSDPPPPTRPRLNSPLRMDTKAYRYPRVQGGYSALDLREAQNGTGTGPRSCSGLFPGSGAGFPGEVDHPRSHAQTNSPVKDIFLIPVRWRERYRSSVAVRRVSRA